MTPWLMRNTCCRCNHVWQDYAGGWAKVEWRPNVIACPKCGSLYWKAERIQ